MRKTKLYTIEEHEVLADDKVRLHEAYRKVMSMDDIINTRSDEFLLTNEVYEVPVHCVSKIEFGERKDQFIAIHPDLKEILNAPYVGEVNELKREISVLESKIMGWVDLYNKFESKVHEFNALPWYKRIFKKI